MTQKSLNGQRLYNPSKDTGNFSAMDRLTPNKQSTIKSLDYAGRVCTLVHVDTEKPVKLNETVENFRGDPRTVTGGEAPHKPSSSGKIYTKERGGTSYPGTCKLMWKPQLPMNEQDRVLAKLQNLS